MGPSNLPGEGEIVVRDVRFWIPSAMLQLNLKSPPKLLEINFLPI
jgi:hypothetical protein